jgi:hypothetical protein
MKTLKNVSHKHSRKYLKSKRKSKHKKRGGSWWNSLFGKKEEPPTHNKVAAAPNKPNAALKNPATAPNKVTTTPPGANP